MYMIEIRVLGSKWKVHLLDEDAYVRIWGDDSVAQAHPETKELYFNEEELTRYAVTHELVHACFTETCVSSANLTATQVEEVMCEMFALHGDKLMRLSRELYKDLKAEAGV